MRLAVCWLKYRILNSFYHFILTFQAKLEADTGKKIDELLKSPAPRHNAISALDSALQNANNFSFSISSVSASSSPEGLGERKKSATLLEIEKNHSLFLETQGK